MDEKVDGPVRVPRDEVGGARTECHEAAVPADGNVSGNGNLVCLRAKAVDVDPRGGPRLPVVDENVVCPIRVPHDEVGRGRSECHEAAVGADGKVFAKAVCLRAKAVDVDPRGGDRAREGFVEDSISVGISVVDENVVFPIRVPRDEVGGGRTECHEAAVGADRNVSARAVALRTKAVDTDPRGGPGLKVVDENVTARARVPRHEVGSGRDERHEAAVPADGTVFAKAV